MCSAKGIVISGQKADEVRGDNNLVIQSTLYCPEGLKILAKAVVIFKAMSPEVFKCRKTVGK